MHELTLERDAQLELTQALLTTLEHLIDEQAEIQREVEQLQARVDALAPSAGGRDGEGHRTLREEAHHAQRHAAELLERSGALSARASELMAESRSMAASLPGAEPSGD